MRLARLRSTIRAARRRGSAAQQRTSNQDVNCNASTKSSRIRDGDGKLAEDDAGTASPEMLGWMQSIPISKGPIGVTDGAVASRSKLLLGMMKQAAKDAMVVGGAGRVGAPSIELPLLGRNAGSANAAASVVAATMMQTQSLTKWNLLDGRHRVAWLAALTTLQDASSYLCPPHTKHVELVLKLLLQEGSTGGRWHSHSFGGQQPKPASDDTSVLSTTVTSDRIRDEAEAVLFLVEGFPRAHDMAVSCKAVSMALVALLRMTKALSKLTTGGDDSHVGRDHDNYYGTGENEDYSSQATSVNACQAVVVGAVVRMGESLCDAAVPPSTRRLGTQRTNTPNDDALRLSKAVQISDRVQIRESLLAQLTNVCLSHAAGVRWDLALRLLHVPRGYPGEGISPWRSRLLVRGLKRCGKHNYVDRVRRLYAEENDRLQYHHGTSTRHVAPPQSDAWRSTVDTSREVGRVVKKPSIVPRCEESSGALQQALRLGALRRFTGACSGLSRSNGTHGNTPPTTGPARTSAHRQKEPTQQAYDAYVADRTIIGVVGWSEALQSFAEYVACGTSTSVYGEPIDVVTGRCLSVDSMDAGSCNGSQQQDLAVGVDVDDTRGRIARSIVRLALHSPMELNAIENIYTRCVASAVSQWKSAAGPSISPWQGNRRHSAILSYDSALGEGYTSMYSVYALGVKLALMCHASKSDKARDDATLFSVNARKDIHTSVVGAHQRVSADSVACGCLVARKLASEATGMLSTVTSSAAARRRSVPQLPAFSTAKDLINRVVSTRGTSSSSSSSMLGMSPPAVHVELLLLDTNMVMPAVLRVGSMRRRMHLAAYLRTGRSMGRVRACRVAGKRKQAAPSNTTKVKKRPRFNKVTRGEDQRRHTIVQGVVITSTLLEVGRLLHSPVGTAVSHQQRSPRSGSGGGQTQAQAQAQQQQGQGRPGRGVPPGMTLPHIVHLWRDHATDRIDHRSAVTALQSAHVTVQAPTSSTGIGRWRLMAARMVWLRRRRELSWERRGVTRGTARGVTRGTARGVTRGTGGNRPAAHSSKRCRSARWGIGALLGRPGKGAAPAMRDSGIGSPPSTMSEGYANTNTSMDTLMLAAALHLRDELTVDAGTRHESSREQGKKENEATTTTTTTAIPWWRRAVLGNGSPSNNASAPRRPPSPSVTCSVRLATRDVELRRRAECCGLDCYPLEPRGGRRGHASSASALSAPKPSLLQGKGSKANAGEGVGTTRYSGTLPRRRSTRRGSRRPAATGPARGGQGMSGSVESSERSVGWWLARVRLHRRWRRRRTRWYVYSVGIS